MAETELPTADAFFGAPAPKAPAELPTADEAFGPSELPSAEEFFGPAPQENFAARLDKKMQESIFRIQNAFGIGAKAGFGDEPITTPSTALSPETEALMKRLGLFNDYARGQHSFTKGLFEGVSRNAIAGLALAQRAANAALSAPAEAIGQAAEEVGLVGQGQATGEGGLRGALTDPGIMMALGPYGVYGEIEAAAKMGKLRDLANMHEDLARARAAAVIGEGEAAFHDVAPVTPEAAAARVDAAREAGVEPHPIPATPPDVHAVARQIDPEAFKAYDALPENVSMADPAVQDVAADVNAAYAQARSIMPEPDPMAALKPVEEAPKPVDAAPAYPDAMAEEPATASTTSSPTAQKTVSGGLPAVKGTGELKTRGLSEGVEAKAIEDGISKTFGDLPEYRQLSMADQAARAKALIESDYEAAKTIALGQKAPPRGTLPESVFVGVEKRALAEGDVDTLRQLATESKLTTAATTMGQRIRTLGERDPASPVGAIQDVQRAREAALVPTFHGM